MLAIGVTTVLAIPDLAAQITTGALTTAGAALSGYLSVTFLKTFAMTSKQMSYYYGQPLVHCYLLLAEWLTDRFDPQTDSTTRTAVHRELIHAALEASRNAQHHLMHLQETAAGHPGMSHPLAPARPTNGRYPTPPADPVGQLTHARDLRKCCLWVRFGTSQARGRNGQ